jgi:hypothetical protein
MGGQTTPAGGQLLSAVTRRHQFLAGVVCEQFAAVADVLFKGREAAVPRDIRYFEQACSASCGRGEESGALRVGRELFGIEASAAGRGI